MTLSQWLAIGYLSGSIPTSYLAGRIAGIDLRERGSKNLGATNVYRVLGWKYAIPVGLIDVAKGAIPVALSRPSADGRAWLPLVIGCAAVIGHVFSVFLRFRGGKGVATAAGVVLALAPGPLGVCAAVWLGVLLVSGYVSLASMLGAATFPVAVRLLEPGNSYALWVGVALAVFILYTHRGNVARLIAGTENRFGRRAKTGGKGE